MGKSKSIVKSAQNKPVKKTALKISQIEKFLLKKFPRKTACEWDKTGLLVGDPKQKLSKVALALDPTIEAIRVAKASGCNLLLTHHPVYLSEIEFFKPADSVAEVDGAAVFEAVNSGIALMNFHTALDVSAQGLAVLPKILNLKQLKVLNPVDGLPQVKSKLGFGKICTLKPNDKGMTLEQMAARCKSLLGRAPRVWGDMSHKLKKIVTFTGSIGRLSEEGGALRACVDQNVDCIICGEVKYHDALALKEAGICVLDLGHDLSELPLLGVLANCLLECGVNKNDIIFVNQNNN